MPLAQVRPLVFPRRGALVVCAVLGAARCVSPGGGDLGGVEEIQPKTIIDHSLSAGHFLPEAPKTIVVPAGLVNVTKVVRPWAEGREGPATYFNLKKFLFRRGTRLVALEKVGVWTKVLRPELDALGWVHSKTLENIHPNTKPILIRTNFLPSVFARRSINKIYKHPNFKSYAVELPRGTQFLALKRTPRRTMIWIPRTKSVAWVSSRFVQ